MPGYQSFIEHIEHVDIGYVLFVITLLGLIVGSFLNVVVARLPVMMQRQWRQECCELLNLDKPEKEEVLNIVRPRSRCPHCATQIRIPDNIPLLSFLLLRGHCRTCQKPISARYPLVEFAAAVVAICAVLRFGVTPQTMGAMVLSWWLLCLSLIDLDHMLLPNQLTLPLLWLGIIVNLFGLFVDVHASLLGAIFGYLSLWVVFHVFKLCTNKEGIGYGDFKLLAALGAWFGWQALPSIILLASLSGSIVGISMLLLHRVERNTPIPFGPYLALGGWCHLIWGEQIMRFLPSI